MSKLTAPYKCEPCNQTFPFLLNTPNANEEAGISDSETSEDMYGVILALRTKLKIWLLEDLFEENDNAGQSNEMLFTLTRVKKSTKTTSSIRKGDGRLARHRKHEKRLQRQLRDVRTLCVRIPRQNIVVNVSQGLSVTVLPESLDLLDPQPFVCTVSLSLSVISDSVVHSVERLLRFLLGILYINSPLLCKVQVHIFCTHNVTVSFSVSITSEFCWTISVQNKCNDGMRVHPPYLVYLGGKVGFMDESLPYPAIRHDKSFDHSWSKTSEAETQVEKYHITSHVNYRYQPVSTVVKRLKHLRKEYRKASFTCRRLKEKIKQSCVMHGRSVDLPKDSFLSIFWQQQSESAAVRTSKNMRWHPLMIRWCLSLRHNGAYEA
ncbi:hypothetical protein EMCRGX_G017039 [Ephydatia muelleri]